MRNNSSGCERAYPNRYMKPGFWAENFYELSQRYPTMKQRYLELVILYFIMGRIGGALNWFFRPQDNGSNYDTNGQLIDKAEVHNNDMYEQQMK